MGVSSTSTLWFRPNRSRIFLGNRDLAPLRYPHDASVRNPAALFHTLLYRTVGPDAAACIRPPGAHSKSSRSGELFTRSWTPQTPKRRISGPHPLEPSI